jgi:3-oxoadipate enol-lactonase
MAFLDFEMARTEYEISGDEGLPVLLFSNSLGANLAMWEPQVTSLAPHFRILRYDTHGHGKSSAPSGPYTVEKLGYQALNLLDHIGLERASFCGISMGGIIGQWLAINFPERIDKLILADTAAKIGTSETWDNRIETVLRDGLNSLIPGLLERWFTPRFHAAHAEIAAATVAMVSATNVQGYVACCAALRDADFRSSLQAIRSPTLVIAATNDPVTTPQDGRFLAEAIPGARYVELAAAHLSNVEAADEFNAALLGFLEG